MRSSEEKEFLKNLGENVKKLRKKKNLTQAKLAIDCEVDVSVISRIERGVINTSITNLKKIADNLNIQLYELFVEAS